MCPSALPVHLPVQVCPGSILPQCRWQVSAHQLCGSSVYRLWSATFAVRPSQARPLVFPVAGPKGRNTAS